MSESLKQLEAWTLFHETDGFLVLHYTDCGRVTLMCGKEVSIPSDFVACPHWEQDDCGCPDAGYVVEFRAGPRSEGCSYPGDDGDHAYAFGVTLHEACDALVGVIRERQLCSCRAAVEHG